LATYAEKLSDPESDINIFHNKNIDLDNIPPLKEIAITDNFWRHKGMYTAGSMLIYYLIEKWGWDKLKNLFLISEFEDPDIEKHFFEVYDTSLDAVDIEWREFLRTKLE
jgi:hypothetical protein